MKFHLEEIITEELFLDLKKMSRYDLEIWLRELFSLMSNVKETEDVVFFKRIIYKV
jgi:hypothetical protein